MLNRLSFKNRIAALVACAIAGIVLLTVIGAVHTAQGIDASRHEQLRTAVESAHGIVAGFQARAASGAMSEADAQHAAKEALRVARYGGADGRSEFYELWRTDGVAVMHPLRPDFAGQDLRETLEDGEGRFIVKELIAALRASDDGRAFVDTSAARPAVDEPVPRLQYVMLVPGWDWIVSAGADMDDVGAQVRREVLADVAVSAAVLAVIAALGVVVARSVLRQIGGEPAEAIAAMEQVAAGNLAVALHDAPRDSLLAALGRMTAALRTAIGQVRVATDGIATASSEIALGNQDLSARTEQTASNLQQTAASMDQLTGTVRQTADSARTANQLACRASDSASMGGVVVAQVVSTMDGINAASRRIADIIGVIDDIAVQTNLLALNAAVEAARAGEQGRGFAVVATEVRNLAQRSATAAREIKTLIGASVEKVDSGLKLVQDAGAAMNEIVASVRRVSDIIGVITAAAAEQSEGIGQVNGAVVHLDRMTQQNAALVEQSAAAAEALRQQALRLAQAIGAFRLVS
jgi:methyl-accepting chemotaxis protein